MKRKEEGKKGGGAREWDGGRLKRDIKTKGNKKGKKGCNEGRLNKIEGRKE